jgi:hypothetical protein
VQGRWNGQQPRPQAQQPAQPRPQAQRDGGQPSPQRAPTRLFPALFGIFGRKAG